MNNRTWIIEREGAEPPEYFVWKTGETVAGTFSMPKPVMVLRRLDKAVRFGSREVAQQTIDRLVEIHWCDEGDLVAVLRKRD